MSDGCDLKGSCPILGFADSLETGMLCLRMQCSGCINSKQTMEQGMPNQVAGSQIDASCAVLLQDDKEMTQERLEEALGKALEQLQQLQVSMPPCLSG